MAAPRFVYRVFGLRLASDIPFPLEVEESPEITVDFTFRVTRGPPIVLHGTAEERHRLDVAGLGERRQRVGPQFKMMLEEAGLA